MDPQAMRHCMGFGFSDKKSDSSIGRCMKSFSSFFELVSLVMILQHISLIMILKHKSLVMILQHKSLVMILQHTSLLIIVYLILRYDSLDGNGFKTSTMRLGADVIVFSRHFKNQ